MAEFEFAGMTFKGGKMFVILTALSTLGGGAWGAFEFYNDYRNMKETIESYVAPDMSGIEQELAVQSEEMASLRVLVESLDVKVEKAEDSLSEDMDKVEDYHSHNTEQLDVEGMKKLLLKLDFIKEDISNI